MLTDAIYDAAVEPAGWPHALGLLRRRFSSSMQAFYFLSIDAHSTRVVHVDGIDGGYVRSFSEHFFRSDNPCLQSEPLHRPGVVRTDQRLVRYFKDAHVLKRSQYYNEWMRPQDAEHTMGTTVLADRTTIGNISLLRPRTAGGYRAEEVAAFANLCGHLRRAIQIGLRLETVATRANATRETLDVLPHGVVLVDLAGRLLHANYAAENLFRQRAGVTVRDGRVVAACARDREAFANLLRRVGADPVPDDGTEIGHVTVSRPASERPLTVSAIRLSARARLSGHDQPIILLVVVDPDAIAPASADLVRQRYGFTPAETRLAVALMEGGGVKQAADQAQMTYETARWYLKILLQKTDTARQAELVARLLRDTTLPVNPRFARHQPNDS